MEIKLSVSIGATLQVKNEKGDWDWIKPEVGCEVKLIDGEIKAETMPSQFAAMWDEVVGPQFASVVQELLTQQTPKEEVVEETTEDDTIVGEAVSSEEFIEKLESIMEDGTTNDDEEYY
jgi:hypothetical protein